MSSQALYQSSADQHCALARTALAKMDGMEDSTSLNEPEQLEDYDGASHPIYHPIFAKRWIDHNDEDEEWYEDEDGPIDARHSPIDARYSDWMQDTVAFIGNSIAFDMGSAVPIYATTWSYSPDPDKVSTHRLTVPFEVRSARGVLTLAEVYHGIQGAIWMNHTWACGHVFFEGIREVHDYREEQTGQPTLAEATRWGPR